MIKWFEIPVKDLAISKSFYQHLLQIELQELIIGNGLTMAVFPEPYSGALCFHEEFYFPGAKGVIIYLNADPDLQTTLDRISGPSGTIIIPKRQISEERGYMALFSDPDGNRIGLISSQ